MTFLTTVKQTNKQTNNDCLNDFAAILVSSFSIKTDGLSFVGNLLHINDLDSRYFSHCIKANYFLFPALLSCFIS